MSVIIPTLDNVKYIYKTLTSIYNSDKDLHFETEYDSFEETIDINFFD
jgi:hypothetical protein